MGQNLNLLLYLVALWKISNFNSQNTLHFKLFVKIFKLWLWIERHQIKMRVFIMTTGNDRSFVCTDWPRSNARYNKGNWITERPCLAIVASNAQYPKMWLIFAYKVNAMLPPEITPPTFKSQCEPDIWACFAPVPFSVYPILHLDFQRQLRG